MTFLEFIRKNLFIAFIVIVGILLGLIMMDYGDSGSAFSRSYRVKIKDTRYKIEELMPLAQTGYQLRTTHPNLYGVWANCGNPSLSDGEKLAVNRLLVREMGKELGIAPSGEQIDTYIRGLNSFIKDGEFNMEQYKQVVGEHNGEISKGGEAAFRALISDIIIWNNICNYLAAGIKEDTAAVEKIYYATTQTVSGIEAKIKRANIPAPEQPDAEAVKKHWEATKANYTTDEQRAVSVITINAGEDPSLRLETLANSVLEALVKTPDAAPMPSIESGLDEQYRPEGALEDYIEIIPCAACTRNNLPAILKINVGSAEQPVQLADAAFDASRTADNIQRYSEVKFDSNGNTAYIVRVDAITPPVQLSEEAAAPAAKESLIKKLNDEALTARANEVYNQINTALSTGADMTTAFNAAKESGAEVAEFRALPIANNLDLLKTGVGKLVEPYTVTEDVITITGITQKTVADNKEEIMQLQNTVDSMLGQEIMVDWLLNAYKYYKVTLAEE